MTSINLGELQEFLRDALVYPVDRSAVVGQIGSVEIEAPDRRASETVAMIVSSLSDETYDSADELFDTIIGNLSDEYIGRKFYDDRGHNIAESPMEPGDEQNASF